MVRCLLALSLLFSQLAAAEFPFSPPPNFILRPDYIAVHHPVTTKDVAAQLYFDQGLTLLYAFNHDAAYWSFLRASEVDPQLAMAYWGMALALGPNINMDPTKKAAETAYKHVQKALSLVAGAGNSEQDYIRALAKRYKEKGDNESEQAVAYSQSMKELAAKYVDDPDASTLYAESLLDIRPWDQWNANGEPYGGTLEAVSALERVLKNQPNHLGANHYYIHAIEASPNPERAQMAAQRLQKLLPASGHILHMPSHIYLLLGDYHQAALANLSAIAADHRYIREYGLTGIYPVHYLSHNLYFLSRAYSMAGDFQGAIGAASDLEELYLPHLTHMPDMEYYVPTSLFVYLRFHRWKEALGVSDPGFKAPVTQILWHFGRSVAFAALGDVDRAQVERKLFLEGSSQVQPDIQYGYNKAKTVLTLAEKVMDAKIAEAQRKPDQAIDLWRQAVEAQDVFHYNEPPDWFFAVRESLGGALLRAKRYGEAEMVFREDLVRHPRNGRSLFGLKESLLGQAKTSDLYWVSESYEQAWMYSDTELTVDDL